MTGPEQDEEQEASTFTRWLVIGAIVIIVLISLIAYFAHWGWLSSLWFNYAWSSDKGNGPEAIQQTIIYAMAAVIIIPPVRRWFGAKFHEVHKRIDTVHEKLDEHHEELHDHLHDLTDKLGLDRFERPTKEKE